MELKRGENHPPKSSLVLDYFYSRSGSSKQIWRILVLCVILLGALGIWKSQPKIKPISPNAAAQHPFRTGVIDSLYLIRSALSRFLDANQGSFPANANQLAAQIVVPDGWPYHLNPKVLLPYIKIVSKDQVKAPLVEVGPGRFVLLIYLKGNGPMNFDAPYALGELDDIYRTRHTDDEIIASFGEGCLTEVKANAFPMPNY